MRLPRALPSFSRGAQRTKERPPAPRIFGEMARRALPALLAFAALLSDVGAHHGFALALLLLAIPAALVVALDCYGDRLERRCGGARPILAALCLVLLVLSAALRSPAVVGGVPQFAVSALVVTVLLYSIAAAGALVPPRRSVVVTLPARETTQRRRRAA